MIENRVTRHHDQYSLDLLLRRLLVSLLSQ